ncbi:four helix bundle protein [Vibrio fluminensis]|uniref:four helix bundle protein n=1 Tax=Vibrio fluminensis TaxID=2783614 RepID=UPI0018880E6A|nr:four helix bundle protein [Vibrio fluminensis]
MKYQNLDVWKLSFALCKETYLQFRFTNDYAFRDQIRRSALSIPSNIAEGVERYSDKETAYFFNVAKGSTGELKTQLMMAKELNYIPQSDCDLLCEQCERISKMLFSLIRKHRRFTA